MLITLEHAAKILTHQPDEVMFMVQSGDLNAQIHDEDMTWQFEINEVLELKAKLDEARNLMHENSSTVFTDED